MNSQIADIRSGPRRLDRLALGVGVLAVALWLLALGGFWLAGDVAPLVRSYLVGHLFWFGISLGSLALIMIHNLTGGRWGWELRVALEPASRTLPVVAVLFIPVIVALPMIYIWARPDVVASSHLLQHKAIYLNSFWFIVRALVYFAIWIGVALLLDRWTWHHARTTDPEWLARVRNLSGPGLVLYGLTITFACTDWVMSLQPDWYSTVYAFIFASLQLNLALVFRGARVSRPCSGAGRRNERLNAMELRKLGNLLLFAVAFLAYVAFAQFMLIWIANLPEEIRWYLVRLSGGWEALAWVLVIGQFALPFVLLLFRRIKQRPAGLAFVAGWLLLMCLFNFFWQVIPAFEPSTLGGHWPDMLGAVLATGALGGVWLAAFLLLRGRTSWRKAGTVP